MLSASLSVYVAVIVMPALALTNTAYLVFLPPFTINSVLHNIAVLSLGRSCRRSSREIHSSLSPSKETLTLGLRLWSLLHVQKSGSALSILSLQWLLCAIGTKLPWTSELLLTLVISYCSITFFSAYLRLIVCLTILLSPSKQVFRITLGSLNALLQAIRKFIHVSMSRAKLDLTLLNRLNVGGSLTQLLVRLSGLYLHGYYNLAPRSY
ncbi:MAG: hypothetical protein WDW20_03825 [Neisseriaceae bacterium]